MCRGIARQCATPFESLMNNKEITGAQYYFLCQSVSKWSRGSIHNRRTWLKETLHAHRKASTTPLSSSCSVRHFRAALCLFSFRRYSTASSKACFTKVVSSLSGQRCIARYLLRSSDFCCAHISKQARTRFELAYQGLSCVHTLPLATAQTEFLPSSLLFTGSCAFMLCLGLTGVSESVTSAKGTVTQRRKPPFPQFSRSLLVQPIPRRLLCKSFDVEDACVVIVA